MYIAVPIQQGTHITDLFNILLLGYYCVSHIRITWLYQQRALILRACAKSPLTAP